MILHPPFEITARLMPGLKIGESSYVSIEYGDWTIDGRMRYNIWIDMDEKEFLIDDVCSGVGGGTLQEGMESLLAFLSAAAEAYMCKMKHGRATENIDLFVPEVVEWAYQNSDEIGMLCVELKETPGLIEEE